MILDKREIENLLELSKQNQFLTFDVERDGEPIRLILMTEDTYDELQPSMISRYIH